MNEQSPTSTFMHCMIEVNAAPKLERGMRSALEELRPECSFIVYPGKERYRLSPETEAIGLAELCAEISV